MKLEWFRDGQEFEPEVYDDELEECEKAAGDAKTAMEVIRARARLVRTVLSRSLPSGEKVALRLTTHQINHANTLIWANALGVEPPRPLDESKPSGAPSTSPASHAPDAPGRSPGPSSMS